ncbi:MAG: hypothetical protein DMF17_04015 [Verrucomicrobia bacterium]|nr:MAG: hypothetical protein DMF17_04015 [Verrucomicrobiota bacterium]
MRLPSAKPEVAGITVASGVDDESGQRPRLQCHKKKLDRTNADYVKGFSITSPDVTTPKAFGAGAAALRDHQIQMEP